MKTIFKMLFAVVMTWGVSVVSWAANVALTTAPEVVIVAPMCAPTEWWGQNKANTHDGYLGDKICGCDPTAWGQILTYYGRLGYAKDWTAPTWTNKVYVIEEGETAQKELEERTTGTLVTANNRNGERTSAAGVTSTVAPWSTYTWAVSTMEDTDQNGTVDGKDHAGRLLWDLNVIGGAVYDVRKDYYATKTTLFQKDSNDYLTEAANNTALTDYFSFLKGKGWNYALPTKSGVLLDYWKGEFVETLLRASLQTGAPVQVGVTGHAIICDGFGFHNGVPYFHINYGWCGSNNYWVPLEWFWGEMSIAGVASFVHCVVNVHPEDVGGVIAGVVLDAGVPEAGVTVTLTDGTTTQTTVTDQTGAYVFKKLKEKIPYTVTAKGESKTVTLDEFVDEVIRQKRHDEQEAELGKDDNRDPYPLKHGHAVVDFEFPGLASLLTRPYATWQGSDGLNSEGAIAFTMADSSATALTGTIAENAVSYLAAEEALIIASGGIEIDLSDLADAKQKRIAVEVEYSVDESETSGGLIELKPGSYTIGLVQAADGKTSLYNGTDVYNSNTVDNAPPATGVKRTIAYTYASTGNDNYGSYVYADGIQKHGVGRLVWSESVVNTIKIGTYTGTTTALPYVGMKIHKINLYVDDLATTTLLYNGLQKETLGASTTWEKDSLSAGQNRAFVAPEPSTLTLAGDNTVGTLFLDGEKMTVTGAGALTATKTFVGCDLDLTGATGIINLGDVTLADGITLTLAGAATSTFENPLTVGYTIRGAGKVKIAGGVVKFTVSNAYTGGTEIVAGAELVSAHNTALGTAEGGATIGAGTLTLAITNNSGNSGNAVPLVNTRGLTDEDWTGTVVVKTSGANVWLEPAKYGHEGSAITFDSASGYMNTQTITAPVTFVNKGLQMLNGSSSSTATVTIKTLRGDGSLLSPDKGAWQYDFILQDVSAFTGNINLSASSSYVDDMGVTFGASAGAKGTITVQSGATATLHKGVAWTAVNGLSVAGTLELHNADTAAAMVVDHKIAGAGTLRPTGDSEVQLTGDLSGFTGTLEGGTVILAQDATLALTQMTLGDAVTFALADGATAATLTLNAGQEVGKTLPEGVKLQLVLSADQLVKGYTPATALTQVTYGTLVDGTFTPITETEGSQDANGSFVPTYAVWTNVTKDNTWNTAGNWSCLGTAMESVPNGKAVSFTDLAAVTDATVSVTANVTPALILVENKDTVYTINQGSAYIQGNCVVTKRGTGTLTLGAAGAVGTNIAELVVEEGTVVVGDHALQKSDKFGSALTVKGGTLDLGNSHAWYAGTDEKRWLTQRKITLGGSSVPAEIKNGNVIPYTCVDFLEYVGGEGVPAAKFSANIHSVYQNSVQDRYITVGKGAGTEYDLEMSGTLGMTGGEFAGTTFVKKGEGTLKLSGENNFPVLTIEAGKVLMGHAEAFSATMTIAEGATLDLNGNLEDGITLSGAGTLTNSNTETAVELTAAQLATFTGTVDGNITVTVDLSKVLVGGKPYSFTMADTTKVTVTGKIPEYLSEFLTYDETTGLVEETYQALPYQITWMPMGDSITEGETYMGPATDAADYTPRSDGRDGGYRYQLWKYLEAGNQDTLSVGYRSGHQGTDEATANPDWAWHCGLYGGIVNPISYAGAQNFNVEASYEHVGYPEVVTLMLGINDLSYIDNAGGTESDVYAAWKTLVNKLAKNRPHTKIVVSTLFPLTSTNESHSRAPVFNEALRADAEAGTGPFENKNVIFADVNQWAFNGEFQADCFKPTDGLHPNLKGSKIFAQAFRLGVLKALDAIRKDAMAITQVHNAITGKIAVRFNKPIKTLTSANLTLSGTDVQGATVTLTLAKGALDATDKYVVMFDTTETLIGGTYTATFTGALTDALDIEHTNLSLTADGAKMDIVGSGAEANVEASFLSGFKRISTTTLTDNDNYNGAGPAAENVTTGEAVAQPIARVGYYVELKRPGKPAQFVWVSMDAEAFDRNAMKVGIPTATTGAHKAIVTKLSVYGNRGNFEKSVTNGRGIVEFTPWSWTANDQTGYVNEARGGHFGWNDTLETAAGTLKGCMQVAHILEGQDGSWREPAAETLFAFNHFNTDTQTDLGIGSFAPMWNNSGSSKFNGMYDWTEFSSKSGYTNYFPSAYQVKTIEVWVEPMEMPTWTGALDGDWKNAANWADGVVPETSVAEIALAEGNTGAPLELLTGTYSTVFYGNGALVIAEGAEVTLTAHNRHDGGTVVSEGATLNITSLDNVGGSDQIVTVNGTLVYRFSGNTTLNDLDGIVGTGTLKFTSSSGYLILVPNSEDKVWAETLSLVNETKAGILLKHDDWNNKTLKLRNLSGAGTFRNDWGTGTINLEITQTKDTTWTGGFNVANNSERKMAITVKAEGDAPSKTLTLTNASGSAAGSTLQIDAAATVNLTGTWAGSVALIGTLKGSGKINSGVTFADGAILDATEGTTLEVGGTLSLRNGTLKVYLPATAVAASEVARSYTVLKVPTTASLDTTAVKVYAGVGDVLLETATVACAEGALTVTVPANTATAVLPAKSEAVEDSEQTDPETGDPVEVVPAEPLTDAVAQTVLSALTTHNATNANQPDVTMIAKVEVSGVPVTTAGVTTVTTLPTHTVEAADLFTGVVEIVPEVDAPETATAKITYNFGIEAMRPKTLDGVPYLLLKAKVKGKHTSTDFAKGTKIVVYKGNEVLDAEEVSGSAIGEPAAGVGEKWLRISLEKVTRNTEGSSGAPTLTIRATNN